MKTQDALNILAISGDYNPQIIKAAYRKACSLYHPDRNAAGLEMMKLVNQAYELLKNATGSHDTATHKDFANYGEAIASALNAIIGLNLEIELCGSWVWLHGDTKPHKEILKANGFMWAPKKMLWYFRPADYKSRARGNYSMDDIRNTHGSEKIDYKQRNQLRAA